MALEIFKTLIWFPLKKKQIEESYNDTFLNA